MRVEPAERGDLDALADAWVALASEQRQHGSHLAAADNRTAMRSVIAAHVVAGTCLVARTDGGGLAGFVNVGLEEAGLQSDAVRGMIHNVYVAPEERGAGVGSALLEAAEAKLAERGADVVAIEALAENAGARRLYERRGYSPHRVAYERTTETDTSPSE